MILGERAFERHHHPSVISAKQPIGCLGTFGFDLSKVRQQSPEAEPDKAGGTGKQVIPDDGFEGADCRLQLSLEIRVCGAS